jgi:hypothetical protein
MTHHPTFVRAMAWWRLAESMIAGLTQPKADIASVDADVERLFLDSALAGTLRSGAAALHRAWLTSGLRRVWTDGADALRSLDRSQAVRAAGVTLFIASAVVLILQTLRAL